MPLPAWLPALPWAAPFLGLARLARRTPSLAEVAPASGIPLSIIIPARNEAGTIATVLGSILESKYAPLEVLVVDDRSTDDTAGHALAASMGDPRVRVIHGAELPPGWYGKPWACLQGAREATGSLLLFTDADTRHAPELHGRAVAMLEREGSDLVTVSPTQRCVTFWERLVMPQVWVLLGLRYPPHVVNRARHRRDLVANGQFILVRREAYEAAGTHEAVRQEVAEDLALAHAFFDAGRRMTFAWATDYMETRMYRGLGPLIEGWSKNLYLGSRRSYPDEPLLRAVAPAMVAGGLAFWLAPTAMVLAGIGGWVPALLMPGAIAWALTASFWAVVSAAMSIPPWYGLLHPLGAAMALYILARSTWRGAGQVEWRGRTYDDRSTRRDARER